MIMRTANDIAADRLREFTRDWSPSEQRIVEEVISERRIAVGGYPDAVQTPQKPRDQ